MQDAQILEATHINLENAMEDKISKAARIAGDWWADKLDNKYADKKDEFALAVSSACELDMRKNKQEHGRPSCRLDVDYDPQGVMLDVVRKVIDSGCRGYLFSAKGILPYKHSLLVKENRIVQKAGYGNFFEDIII